MHFLKGLTNSLSHEMMRNITKVGLFIKKGMAQKVPSQRITQILYKYEEEREGQNVLHLCLGSECLQCSLCIFLISSINVIINV